MEHKTRCSNAQYLIDYFIDLGISESQLFKDIEEKKSFISNPHSWLSIKDFHQIMQNCQEYSPDLTLDDWQNIAFTIKDNEATGIWKIIVKFIGIKALYSLAPRYTKSFNTYINLKINSITKNSVDCLIISDKNVCSDCMTRWTAGVLQAVPCVLGLPSAKTHILFDQCDLKSLMTGLYKKHNIKYEEKKDIIYANGEPVGQHIQLKKNLANGKNIFTNDFSYDKPYNATLITKDLLINNKHLLKKGEIFNAPYSRALLAWAEEAKPRFRFSPSQRLKEELLISYNEQLTLAEERYFESEHLRKKEQEKNIQLETALREIQETKNVLEQHWAKKEQEKIKAEKEIILNIKKVIKPSFLKLNHCGLNVNQQKLVNQLADKIRDILLPLSEQTVFKDYTFTPSEFQIARLIQSGKSSKEICELLNLSIRTIETHRMNIRRKLNISNKNINLSSYLMSIK